MQDSEDYREPTEAEKTTLDPANPIHFNERVRILLPLDGKVDNARVLVLDQDRAGKETGKEHDLINVLRTVITLEPTSMAARGDHSLPGTAVAYITLWHSEIGKMQFIWARCVFGRPPPMIQPPNLHDVKKFAN